MAKLRHISIAVPDIEAAAHFYERTFGLERVKQSERNICLSDGTINITLTPPSDLSSTDCKKFVGVHHLGFVVEDKEAMKKTIHENGGRVDGNKCYDPNDIIVNIADKNWVGSQ